MRFQPLATRRRRRTPKDHSFITNFGIVLTIASVLLLVILSILFAPTTTSTTTPHRRLDDDHGDYSNYSCGSLNEVVPTDHSTTAQQCAFARTCNQGQGLWAPFVYCTSSPRRRLVYLLLLSPAVLVYLVLLFRCLGSTAEDYFSPALEMLSHQFGLPPRFAGVSLLALGNGAADVSATVSAITSDPQHGYQLSLGALTGAAMFISGVIAAAVTITAQGVPCRGALVRDVGALVVTVGTVWGQLRSGSVAMGEAVTLFVSMYLVFVAVVLMADVYHRAVVIPRLTRAAGTAEEERQMSEDRNAATSVRNVLEGTDGLHRTTTTTPNATTAGGRWSHMLTALSNYDNISSTEQQMAVESDDLLLQDRPIQLHGQGGLLSGGTGSPQSVMVNPDDDHTYALLENHTTTLCVGAGADGVAASWREAWRVGRAELYAHAERTYDDIAYDGDLNGIQKFLLFLELPFTAVRQLTVPVPCDGYYCRALVATSLAISPLWLAYYISGTFGVKVWGSLQGWMAVLGVEAVVLVMAAALWRYAPGGEGAKLAMPFATPLALYGFMVAATWIDTVAEALVHVLNFWGVVLRIPGPILGLTILAWGNSMGDLSANITMARKGLANMAMTACFAGPVFNILMGLGLGFSSLSAQTGESTLDVEISPSVMTGFIFLALNAVAMLAVGFSVGRIPKHFGYGALVLYGVYLLTSLLVQYSKYGNPN